MRRKKIYFLLVAVAFLSFPGITIAWGPATHTYFAKELGKQYGIINLQEMYGAVLPDTFNFMYDDPLMQNYLKAQTHQEPGFMKVVNIAKCFCLGKGLGFGFASHNDDWGADFTAHHDSTTMPPEAPEEGYVVFRENILAPQIKPIINDFLTEYNIAYDAEELAHFLAHNSLEIAVDYLVSINEDPFIGLRMLFAAEYRPLYVPVLLSYAYAKDLANEFPIIISEKEAAAIIIGVESEFKSLMKKYGEVLTMPNDKKLSALAQLGAQLAEEMLVKLRKIVDPPPEFTDALIALMQTILQEAKDLVVGDYEAELSGTLDHLEDALEGLGIETCSW